MAEKLVNDPVDSAGEQGPAGPSLVNSNIKFSLLKATVAHGYITEANIAKKEVSPVKLLQYMSQHAKSPLDDFCGGPVRSPFFMVIGMLSRIHYLSNRFDRATFYMNNNCGAIYGDFDYVGPRRRGVLNIKATDIKQDALLTNPYKIIMDKLKTSYPKKAHTMLDVDPETDGIMIQSDVLFEGKRHCIVHYIGGQRIRYT